MERSAPIGSEANVEGICNGNARGASDGKEAGGGVDALAESDHAGTRRVGGVCGRLGPGRCVREG